MTWTTFLFPATVVCNFNSQPHPLLRPNFRPRHHIYYDLPIPPLSRVLIQD
ncbi:hypothetical protein K435DRAFT_776200, partial [Dendrothele bispora CBS 962.96]